MTKQHERHVRLNHAMIRSVDTVCVVKCDGGIIMQIDIKFKTIYGIELDGAFNLVNVLVKFARINIKFIR